MIYRERQRIADVKRLAKQNCVLEFRYAFVIIIIIKTLIPND